MEDFLNKWVYLETLYYKSDFQEINKLEYIHPEDRDFVKNNLTNTFYQCLGIEDNYLTIKSKKYKLRIKPNVIKGYLPSPKFNWGDKVFQVNKPEAQAVIDDFFWHNKDQKYYYHIIVKGKRKSNRYSETELMVNPIGHI